MSVWFVDAEWTVKSINPVTDSPACTNFVYTFQRENMVALCQVGEKWFGILYSWADNKKKSNLMLSLFVPGE